MNEILIVKRNDSDIDELNTIELIKSLGVILIQKTDLTYLFDFSAIDNKSKLLSIQAIDKYIAFDLSFPYIESIHESENLASKIDAAITAQKCQGYNIISLENQLAINDINALTYSHYLHFEKDSLKPSLIEMKELINNSTTYTGNDFFFSVPYIRSLLFKNNNDKGLKITFVKIKNVDNEDTIALKAEYSNGNVKYADVSYNPPHGKVV